MFTRHDLNLSILGSGLPKRRYGRDGRDMTDLILDTDHSGRSFSFDEQRGEFRFNHQVPESLLAAVVGGPLSSVVECGADYARFSTSTIISAANEDGWLEICIDQANR